MQKKHKNILINVFLILISLSISLVFGEICMRIIEKKPEAKELENNKGVQHQIAANKYGHDKLGYNNQNTKDNYNILAIGDSHTYGQGAKIGNDWPKLASDFLKTPIYNMGMGGSSTVDYYYRLKNTELFFDPKLVIIAIYTGNDIVDAIATVYKKDFYKKYRKEKIEKLLKEEKEKLQTAHKVSAGVDLYRKIKIRSRLFTKAMALYDKLDFKFNQENWYVNLGLSTPDKHEKGHFYVYDKDDKGEVFATTCAYEYRMRLNNRDSEVFQEGMSLTKIFIDEIIKETKKRKMNLLFAFIPTKCSAIKSIAEKKYKKLSDSYKKLLSYEEKNRQELMVFLKDRNIPYVDIKKGLEKAVIKNSPRQIYGVFGGGHPNEDGYAVYAKEISEYLKENLELYTTPENKIFENNNEKKND